MKLLKHLVGFNLYFTFKLIPPLTSLVLKKTFGPAEMVILTN